MEDPDHAGRRQPCGEQDGRTALPGYHWRMMIAEVIAAKAKALSPEAQREVLDFVDFLHTRVVHSGPRKSLAGIWADLGIDLSAEEIDQARHEAWTEFPRRDIF
jgi:hypothetical protein